MKRFYLSKSVAATKLSNGDLISPEIDENDIKNGIKKDYPNIKFINCMSKSFNGEVFEILFECTNSQQSITPPPLFSSL